MIFVYLISAVVAVLFIKFHLHKRRIMKYVGHLPALPEIPIVGSGLFFLGKNTVEMMDMLSLATEMFDTSCRFWLGPFLAVILGKPEDVEAVLLSPKCLDKPYIYSFMDLNQGLVSAPLHVWKPQRKLLNPTFNNKILLSFVPIFNQKARIIADILDKKTGEKAFDISKLFYACTLETVCSTTLGVDLDFQNKKNVKMMETMDSQWGLIANRMVKFWLHPKWIYKWTSSGATFARNAISVREIPKSIRKLKEEEFYEKKHLENNEELKEDEYFSTPQIFVNELFKLRAKKLISDKLLDDQILTMLISGNDTTALTMSNFILMLAMHPKVQERCFQEIKSVHETQTSSSDVDILSKLDYLEMCIKETMRLLPVAPFIARQNTDDVKLSSCTIPKGTALVFSCYHLHRDKKVWGPKADMFDPDNFLPEKVASRHAYSFLPFSGGARGCFGIKYSWLSMKIFVSAILRQYKFSTHLRLEEIIPKFDVLLKIENRHMVTVERREKY